MKVHLCDEHRNVAPFDDTVTRILLDCPYCYALTYADRQASLGNWAENGYFGASGDTVLRAFIECATGKQGPEVETIEGAEFIRRLEESAAKHSLRPHAKP